MKNSRLRRYLDHRASRKNDPMTKKLDVKESNDEHIDQDFEGYPNGQAKESVITPKTKEDKKTAALGTKDGEKKIRKSADKNSTAEEDNGSGGAFEGTESVKE